MEDNSKATKAAVMMLLALALGAAAAAVTWVFVFAMGLSYEYVWQELPALLALPFLPVILCLIGGLLIGLWEKNVCPPPLLLEDSLEIISKEKRFPYKGLYKTLVSSFLPLAFGGAVGPEAGLVNIIAGLCTWIGDKLKAAGVASAELAEAGLAATMTALFGAPVAGLVVPLEGRFEEMRVERGERKDKNGTSENAGTGDGVGTGAGAGTGDGVGTGAGVGTGDGTVSRDAGTAAPPVPTQEPASPLSKRNKLVFYLAAVVGGLAIMLTLSHFFGGGLGLPRFERTEWNPGDILLCIPLTLIGVLAAYLYHAADRLTGRLARIFKNKVIFRTVLCGLVLGFVGSFLPYTMFSGEEQMGELMGNYTAIGAWLLIATGALKICVCPLCVNMGWRGGNIFPVIFAGISLGYGISLLTGLDPTFCIAVLATAITSAVMRKPLIAIAVLLLCFPVADIIFMAIAGLIAGALPLPRFLNKKEERKIKQASLH